ncbi:MAG: SpoIIE family protein phosphatase [Armatimonadetes bacterium]|nr:SpoIIE family protein phosphatase [Armatimonadota bacterium]
MNIRPSTDPQPPPPAAPRDEESSSNGNGASQRDSPPEPAPAAVDAPAYIPSVSDVDPEDLDALYAASASLARSLDLHQTQDAIVMAARNDFGYDRAGLWMYDPVNECMYGTAGTNEALELQREDHLSLKMEDVAPPLRAVLRGDLPYYLTDDLQRDLPQHSSIDNMDHVRSNAVVPLKRDDVVLGYLSVDNVASQRPITDAQVRLLLLFVNYAAAALQNAQVAEQTRLHRAEVELRRQLEQKIYRLEQVHEVAAQITSLNLDAVLRLVRDRLVTVFGFDRAGFLLYDNRDPDALHGTWGTDESGHIRDEHDKKFDLDDYSNLAAIIRKDLPYLLHHVQYEDGSFNEEGVAYEHALIQLRSAQRLLGVLSVDNSLTHRSITEEDIEILLLIAGHASLAIQKAHVFALEQEVNVRLRRVLKRESRIANTLQKAFKPSVGSHLYGVKIAHFYRPAMAESDLGGDFYDVLDLGEGKIGLVMGDVSGKGLKAAARTACTRYALQAFAHEDPDPLSVLSRLNHFLHEQNRISDSDAYVTLFYGLLDSATGEMRCASAGHEPPLLVRKGCEPDLYNLTGVPCGLFPELDSHVGVFRLEPGDRLLLYSDGVTEARQNRQLFDFEGLLQAVKEEGHRPLDSIVRRLYVKVLKYSGGVMRDDVALLMVEPQRLYTGPETERPEATGKSDTHLSEGKDFM